MTPQKAESAAPGHVGPDAVRYLEGLGLPAGLYTSKLEAVGLRNGSMLDAMRKLEEIQRLGGVSIV